jgi:hypothetical protein
MLEIYALFLSAKLQKIKQSTEFPTKHMHNQRIIWEPDLNKPVFVDEEIRRL